MIKCLFYFLILTTLVHSTTFADQIASAAKRKVAQTTAKVDLGKDIMKPLGTAFRSVVNNLADATKNTSTAASLDTVLGLLDKALAITPDTDAYKAENTRLNSAATTNGVTLAPADAARLTQLEYTTLLQAVKALATQMKAAVTAANANACGQACTDLVAQIKDLQTLAHLTFQDPN